jgi:hypothetical protein
MASHHLTSLQKADLNCLAHSEESKMDVERADMSDEAPILDGVASEKMRSVCSEVSSDFF